MTRLEQEAAASIRSLEQSMDAKKGGVLDLLTGYVTAVKFMA